MNNYFKNLFLSVPSTPDGRVGPTKLLSQTLMRTSLKQGASCPYLFILKLSFEEVSLLRDLIVRVCSQKASNSGCKTSSPRTLPASLEDVGPHFPPASQSVCGYHVSVSQMANNRKLL